MPKHKTVSSCNLPFWLRATSGLPDDPQEPFFVQVGESLMRSPAFQTLDHGTRNLYLRLCASAKGHRKFTFSWADAQHKAGYTSKTTFYKHMDTLRGDYIEVLHDGRDTRTKSEYQFCFRWKGTEQNDQPSGKKKLCGWLTARKDNKDSFIQIGASLFENIRFQRLTASAQNLYVCMAIQARDKVQFTYTINDAIRDGFNQATFKRSKKALIEAGFISCTARGQHNFTPNEYMFVGDWKSK